MLASGLAALDLLSVSRRAVLAPSVGPGVVSVVGSEGRLACDVGCAVGPGSDAGCTVDASMRALVDGPSVLESRSAINTARPPTPAIAPKRTETAATFRSRR